MRKQSRKFADDIEGKFCSVAAAVVGAAVVGGVASNMAADKAAGAQGDAANSANATSMAQYNQTRADNAAFLNNGTAASNKLAGLLGIGGPSGTGAGGIGNTNGAWTPDANQYANNPSYKSAWDSFIAEHVARYGVAPDSSIGSNASALPAELAARGYTPTQVSTQNDASYGSLLKKFDQNDLNSDVVYNSGLQFGLNQGTQGINRLAAASGSLNSGATLKALAKFGNDYGSTKANDAYNRYTADNTNIYNKLAGISGGGQTAANTVGAAGANNANALSNTAIGLGNARGASAIAQGNQISNGANSISNYYQQQQMLQQLQQGNQGTYGGQGTYGNGMGFTQTGSLSD